MSAYLKLLLPLDAAAHLRWIPTNTHASKLVVLPLLSSSLPRSIQHRSASVLRRAWRLFSMPSSRTECRFMSWATLMSDMIDLTTHARDSFLQRHDNCCFTMWPSCPHRSVASPDADVSMQRSPIIACSTGRLETRASHNLSTLSQPAFGSCRMWTNFGPLCASAVCQLAAWTRQPRRHGCYV